jgi:hypothetical protein
MKEQSEEALVLKHQIETVLEQCPSTEICEKIKNPAEKRFCIDYVYKHVTDFGMSIDEGIGALEAYLDELNS